MTGLQKKKESYENWWVGKLCRTNPGYEFKEVASVDCWGPPSFVYGTAELIFTDGTKAIIHTTAYKPRKSDVEVLTNSK